MTPQAEDVSHEAERSELIKRLRELFASQRLGVLATCAEGQPHASLVAFAATDDLRHVVFATPRATRKYAQLSANPAVALVVDSRSSDESDFQKATAVTVIGRATEATGEERDRFLAAYCARHSHLQEFATSPTSALVTVVVDKYSIVTQFQNVVELRVDERG